MSVITTALIILLLGAICIFAIIIISFLLDRSYKNLEKQMTMDCLLVRYPQYTKTLGVFFIVFLILMLVFMVLRALYAQSIVPILIFCPGIFLFLIPCIQMVRSSDQIILKVEGNYFAYTPFNGDEFYYHISDLVYVVEDRSTLMAHLKGYTKNNLVFDISSRNVGFKLLLEKLKAENIPIKAKNTI